MQSQNSQHMELSRDQSTWPFQYLTTQTQPIHPRRPALGLNAPGVTGAVIDVYNQVGVPPTSRTKRMKSQEQINTELYGTAPYLGSGDGIMFDVGTSTTLRDSVPMLRGERSRHHVSDVSYNQWYYLTVPPAAQSVADQFGMQSRAEAAYE